MGESFVKAMISPEAWLVLVAINAISVGGNLAVQEMGWAFGSALVTLFAAFMCRLTWREQQ